MVVTAKSRFLTVPSARFGMTSQTNDGPITNYNPPTNIDRSDKSSAR